MNGLPESVPSAVTDLELSQLDLRYEGHRLRQPRLEEGLLSAIAREGIREPLQGVRSASVAILLDGFKRYRCARQLHLHVVPFASWGTDEVSGIVKRLRGSRPHALHLLEEARFVDELRSGRALSVADIAEQLSRSKAWVSLRLGLIAQLTPVVREALFAGDFPVYSYLYSLRPFRRLPEFRAGDLDAFVQALRGKKFSVREIEGLAHGFFRGPESFRAEILRGNLSLPLRQIEEAPVRRAIAQEGRPLRRASPTPPPISSSSAESTSTAMSRSRRGVRYGPRWGHRGCRRRSGYRGKRSPRNVESGSRPS